MRAMMALWFAMLGAYAGTEQDPWAATLAFACAYLLIATVKRPKKRKPWKRIG